LPLGSTQTEGTNPTSVTPVGGGSVDAGNDGYTINGIDTIDDTAGTTTNNPVDIDVLDNDLNIPSSGTLTVSNPTNGTVTINDGGTPNDPSDDIVTYTPNPGFTGTDTFTYTVCNNATPANCDTATVTVNVTDVRADAEDDTATTDEDEPVDIDILDNDANTPTSGTLTVSDPANGTVTINDGGTPNDPSDDTVTYTPDPDFSGTDTFTYTVCDDATPANCDTATVTVDVNPTVDAEDDTATTDEDEPVVIDVLDNDTDVPTSGTLTVSDPANGTVTVDDGGTPDDPSDDTVTYTPDEDFNGTDTFTYTVCDNATPANCETATVTVDVNPTPDAFDDIEETNGDDPVIIDIFDNDNDIPNDGTLTVTNPSNGTVTVDDNGTPNDPSDDVVTYTPNPGFTGTDTFTYTICDSATPPNCSTATVTIEVSDPCLTVYNEFSPNGDGINDYLRINCIDNYTNNTVEIFNRWGNTVYKVKGYRNDDASKRFEGISNGRATINSLDKLPVGTYFYLIDLGDGSPVRKGWIYINR
uniref:Ig-like domain-containing protein n=1 Tax=uncultured Tenacibaculum sp. TaxID=174713 RepID=UPI00261BD6EC